MSHQDKWAPLSLNVEEIETLARHETPGLTARQSERLESALMSRIDRRVTRDPWAGMRVAWLQARLQPMAYLGGSLVLWVAGLLISMVAHTLGAPVGSLVVWAVLAPWMAVVAWVGPTGWRTGALGRLMAAAPLQPWQTRAWQAIGLGALNLGIMAIIATTGLAGVGLKALLVWWVPFALAGGAILWVTSRSWSPRTGTVLIGFLAAADSLLVVGLGALSPGWLQPVTTIPVAAWVWVAGSVLVLVSGIWARLRVV